MLKPIFPAAFYLLAAATGCGQASSSLDHGSSPPLVEGKSDLWSQNIVTLGTISDGDGLVTPRLDAVTRPDSPRFFAYKLVAARGDFISIQVGVSPYPSPEAWLYDATRTPVAHGFGGAAFDDHIAHIDKRLAEGGEYTLIFNNFGDGGGTFDVSFNVSDRCGTLTTCAAAGATCAKIPDGCGGVLDCLDPCKRADGEACHSSAQCAGENSICMPGYAWSDDNIEDGICTETCGGCG